MGIRPPADPDTPRPPTYRLRELLGKIVTVTECIAVKRSDGSEVLDRDGHPSRKMIVTAITDTDKDGKPAKSTPQPEGSAIWVPAWMRFDERGPAGTYRVVSFKGTPGPNGVTNVGFTLEEIPES